MIPNSEVMTVIVERRCYLSGSMNDCTNAIQLHSTFGRSVQNRKTVSAVRVPGKLLLSQGFQIEL